MSGVTNELIKKSKEISENFSDAEYDVLFPQENKLLVL